jgi:opacity protein-like surface antigen
MKINILAAAAGGALLFAAPLAAQAQSQPAQGDILERVFGAVFGNNQQASEATLDSDWNQGRRPFAQRRAALEARIDAAVRNGSLNRDEAEQVRREYDDIVRLEAQYSADGSVSQQQRSDLRARYRAMSERVGGQRNGQRGDDVSNDDLWEPMSLRSRDFEQRVVAGLRDRSLTQAEATRLRADWRALAQVEASYQQGGINPRERADLQARYDSLENRLGGRVDSGFVSDRNTNRWNQLTSRIASAEQNGTITRREADQVRAQLSDLTRLDAAYSANGYSADERAYLTQRQRELDQMLRYNRR